MEIKKALDLIEKAILQAETKEDFKICENAMEGLEKEIARKEKQGEKTIFRTYEKNNPRNKNLKRLVR